MTDAEFLVPPEDELLLIPGPTPVPRALRLAAARPLINHRGPKFTSMYRQIEAGLRPLFGTENGTILIFPASGTGVMESAIVNLFSPGDRVVVGVMGEFGHRFAEIARAFGLQVEELAVPWGTAITPELLRSYLASHDPASIAGVILTQNETSTGVTLDLATLGPQVKEFGLLLVVDAVSAFGGIPMQMDAWGVDVVVTASQKALMCPPGLGLVAVSQSAWAAVEKAKLPRYYWDFRAARKFGERGETPYTPAVSLWFALKEALALINATGLDATYASHRRRAAMVRAGLRALGLELLVKDERIASPTVTAVLVPAGVDGSKVLARLRDEKKVVAAGGQGQLKGKIWRFAHMGAIDEASLLRALNALEEILREEGYTTVPTGTAAKAAQEAAATAD
ncbi:MAG: alanine--glyoxylate aminotransferase family protein [Limnochordales bacterium]|nr:alanine--glyoxylate aminotransferase family protein [Limnochordales bacterium]